MNCYRYHDITIENVSPVPAALPPRDAYPLPWLPW